MTNQYDRSAEDVANIVGLEHVNVAVPDQRLAILFYITGLGLTRDPYLVTGVGNMWANVGRSQFHLPTRGTQILRGHVGLVLPDLDALAQRLETVREVAKHVSVQVISEFVDGHSYAERHVVTVITNDDTPVSREVFVFGKLDEAGRFVSIEELSIETDARS